MTIQDLKNQNLILFEVISGSKAFGLSTPSSDTDIKGVYYLPKDRFFSMNYIPQISNETNDEVYFELGRFVELLLKNNPNTLEILASPEDCILYKNSVMSNLTIELFLSKLVKDTFAGYAISQIKKAQGFKKKIVNPIDKQRKSILDFCFVLYGNNSIEIKEWLLINNLKKELCGLVKIPNTIGIYAIYYDYLEINNFRGILQNELSNELSLSSIPSNCPVKAYLYFNKDGYSSYCKEYKLYWDWVNSRNIERFKMNQSHGKNYDSKNMMHTIRLLQSAKNILKTGTLNIRCANREELLNIKYGKWSYKDLISYANQLLNEIEILYERTSLPKLPNYSLAEDTLIKMRETLY